MGVSKKRGTPKSSILVGFSIINHPFWVTRIFGNTHLYIYICFYLQYNLYIYASFQLDLCSISRKVDYSQLCFDKLAYYEYNNSGQIIATSHDRFSPNGCLVREIPLDNLDMHQVLQVVTSCLDPFL